MSQSGLDRRAFLRNAGLTAFAGAVTTGAPARQPSPPPDTKPPNGKYDFDTIYNRFGTDSTKFDQQIDKYGKDSVQVGMGIADMDFRAAPAITKALHERMQHENWGYLDMTGSYVRSYMQGHHRLEQAPLRRHHQARQSRADRRRASRHHRHAPHLLSSRQQSPVADADLQRLLFRPHRLRHQSRREPAQARERTLLDGLRGSRTPHQPRDQHADFVQSAEPHGQLLERRGSHAAR